MLVHSLDEAFDHLTDSDATLMAGGTDLMVDANFAKRAFSQIVDISQIEEISGWSQQDTSLWLGAGMTYAKVCEELHGLCPSLAAAARTVGSPQIRNRGTLGGNLATASPAGDAFPPLMVCDAVVEVESATGIRSVPIEDFVVSPRRNVLISGEIVRGIRILSSPPLQYFAKVGTRNAMVISVVSLALSIDPTTCQARVALGSAGPTPIRAVGAERYLEQLVDSEDLWACSQSSWDTALRDFARLTVHAADPIDDVRGTAAYRRHALGVLAERMLRWTRADGLVSMEAE